MNKVRTLEVVDYVRQRKYCSTEELMRTFGVSPATIQRDITAIVRANLLRKVHGGLATLDAAADTAVPAENQRLNERLQTNPEQKIQIAQQAESLIRDGDIIFLDSSSTALFLARQLQKSKLANLTVVTNSVSIIQEFHLFPTQIVLIAVGGSFNPQLNSFLGKAALETLKSLKINQAFLSAVGIADGNIYTYHESHAEFLKAVLELSKETHLLLDSSKFNKSALFEICSLDQLDSMISEANPPDSILKAVRQFHLALPS
jgi:DeoR/GlpR family transcriptional regulator of sugar metabolism